MKAKNLILTICLLICCTISAQNSHINQLFNKYENEDDVTVIILSKSLFKMIPGNINTGGVNIKDIVPKIESMKIITTEKKTIKETMYSDFKKIINNEKSYEELMRIKDGKDAITFNVRKEGNDIRELIMLINEEDSFVVIQILGNFTIEDLEKITKDADVHMYKPNY